ITLTTFSDIIRSMLIVKYGGIWMDSTVLAHKKIPDYVWELELFSCKGKDYHFESYSELSLWCIGGSKNSKLCNFLVNAFLYYYRNYDHIRYYLMVDYLMKMALDNNDEVRTLFEKIPFNNENADRLCPHLMDDYSEEFFNEVVRGTFIQKLSYKLEKKFDNISKNNTIYGNILETYLNDNFENN
ncbi:MAG: hypothetical protein IJ736_04190, partial [Firmicutes bacterium]|nr:hypothetical protein [Bacillota bacterium]